ncbi:MAG: type II secretion system minor pseudopilin GspJ [Gammaproteobacteria bacterium]|nr:type II secretion system minor pseudopilin GspJ [Gammaproteobacteria bacterium]
MGHQTNINKRGSSGFTLIEIMIAMAIFAILSVLAYGGLNSVINSRERTLVSMARLQELQVTMSHLQRDMQQIINRPGRDELGSTLADLRASQGEDLIIQFTRNGLRNPAGIVRGHLQRVAYKLDEDKLLRLSWPYVDRASADQVVENTLIENIKTLDLRFLDQQNNWHGNWPALSADPNSPVALPKAIEVKLQMEDWGDIIRVFRVSR